MHGNTNIKYIDESTLESNDVFKVKRALAISVYFVNEYTVAVLLSDICQ